MNNKGKENNLKPEIAQAEMVHKLNIGGMAYKVFLEKGVHNGTSFGCIDNDNMEIHIDYTSPWQRILITVLHEALHGIFVTKELNRYVLDGADPDGETIRERLVTLLAIELLPIFQDKEFFIELANLSVECKERMVDNANQ